MINTDTLLTIINRRFIQTGRLLYVVIQALHLVVLIINVTVAAFMGVITDCGLILICLILRYFGLNAYKFPC